MAATQVTTRKGPNGWELVEGEEVLAVCPKESTAERLGFLLATWRAGSAARPVSEGGRRVPSSPAPAAGPWGGNARPVPGRVYDLSGLAGPERVARDVTDEQRAPAAPAPEVRAEGVTAPEPAADVPAPADPSATSWGASGATVTRAADGSYRVAFPRRPSVEVREALKVAGFRWRPEVGEWHGVRLPSRFLPAFAGGAR